MRAARSNHVGSAVVVVVAGAGLLVWLFFGDAPPDAGSTAVPPGAPAGGAAPLIRAPAAGEVVAARRQRVSSEREPVASAEKVGLLIDAEGRPLAGHQLETLFSGNRLVRGSQAVSRTAGPVDGEEGEERERLSPEEEQALLQGPLAVRSDADGRFRFPGVHDMARCRERGVIVVGHYVAEMDGLDVHVFLATPCVWLSGTVRRPRGEPVAGARVGLIGKQQRMMPRFPLAAQAASLKATVPYLSVLPRATSDDLGRFDLDAVPAIDTLGVRALHEGHSAVVRPVPKQSDVEFDLILREAPRAIVVAGEVRFADGRPAVGAFVDLGYSPTVADQDGRFELRVKDTLPWYPLVACLPGHQPAMLEEFGRKMLEEGDQEGVVLVIAGEGLTIHGRVRDESDRPRAGIKVYVADPTPRPNVKGAKTEDDETTTDASGRFVLGGLAARPYELVLIEPGTSDSLRFAVSDPDGEEVAILFPAEKVVRVLFGGLRSQGGRAISGATVIPCISIDKNPWQSRMQADFSAAAQTDANGNFSIECPVSESLGIIIQGANLFQARVPFGSRAHEVREIVHVEAKVRYRLMSQQFAGADGATLRDEQDRSVGFQLLSKSTPRDEFLRGRLELADFVDVVEVTERARFAVFEKEGEEVLRIPLPPGLPGRTVEVWW